ncbi:MAG: hypothetical protein HYU48_01855 [Candidatus Levybacteria bacterium]|nr:hypothetical protein [Candidatus Levybacteria bacterium]
MRQKHFYSHIVDITSISIEIAEMDLTPDERLHLLSLAESNVHHAVLDTILSELSEEDKKEFLKHVRDESHDKIWDLLKDKVENIENKIKKAAEDLKAELHKDIEEVKSKK